MNQLERKLQDWERIRDLALRIPNMPPGHSRQEQLVNLYELARDYRVNYGEPYNAWKKPFNGKKSLRLQEGGYTH